MDGDSLHAFLFAMKQYFFLTGLNDIIQETCFVSMLLTEHAAIWVQAYSYNWYHLSCCSKPVNLGQLLVIGKLISSQLVQLSVLVQFV